ncbi:MAG TPA: bifunctional aspartate kinase/diaminopimelate decarboxylase [Steroidobacteraceae bacterium]
MTARDDSSWIVLKFGGTSVSTLANWRNIAQVVRERRATGVHILIVHSALTGITDRLDRMLSGALHGQQETALRAIEERHEQLARQLGIPVPGELAQHFAELQQIVAGVALVGEVSDRTRARVMASGELMATALGAAYLQAAGLATVWADARQMLKAEDRPGASFKASVLSATCAFAPDAELERRLRELGPVVLTQGFIASDAEGNTVLLGRGGSDTSASYLAAKLRAQRLEIWTDVPGMFSANPHATPTARLLRALHYDEAQEIATSGAKVLHPRCILPARQHQIPIYVYATQHPELQGTLISSEGVEGDAQVKAVCLKKGITLLALDSPGMWHQVGFLADAFQVFKAHGLSIDLVSTSETNVTVSLDPAANSLDDKVVAALVAALAGLCRVQVIGPCASLSLVGRNIRGILHQLGDAFALFEEQKIYLVSQAANDLNFTFVVDEAQGDRLVDQLHELLVRPTAGDRVLGPTWEQLFAHAPAAARPTPWWETQRQALLGEARARSAAFVYHLPTVAHAARALTGLRSVSRVFYAMKANPHPQLLRAIYDGGLGIECVSRGELEAAFAAIPQLDGRRVLFTPNFAPREEYAFGFERGVMVTLDNLYMLQAWPELLRGREVLLRVDPGTGRGHHQHVRTAGAHSKFGIASGEIPEVASRARELGVRIVGLHAHRGSGVFDVQNWSQTGRTLAGIAERFPEVRILNVGGGIGVPERAQDGAVDLGRLDAAMADLRSACPSFEIWMEPGRFLVSECGVLVAQVTQVKAKGEVRYVGIATGMNSLIRPALYGAHHEIFNLSRLDEPATQLVNVVGPICESADVLGHDRLLPPTSEGDVLLIANAGAYGHSMSSNYNLRAPATEICL